MPDELSNNTDKLFAITRQSMLLGTRGISSFVNAYGKPATRFQLEPERPYISQLTVFLCHATVDTAFADLVYSTLTDIGFKVKYLRADDSIKPGEPARMSDAQVSQKLESEIEDADYFCMLITERSVKRDWVKYEFRVAAARIGRTILLSNGLKGDFNAGWEQDNVKSPVYVDWTIVEYNEADPNAGLNLAREIINDPNQGMSDGRDRPLVIRERNLPLENRLKRYLRLVLENLPEYQERRVEDILPFFWENIGVPDGDYRGAFNWFMLKFGMLGREQQVKKNEINVSFMKFPIVEPVRQEPIFQNIPQKEVNTFILWTGEAKK